MTEGALARIGIAALLLGFLALRLAAIQTVAFNWDELALFDRIARSLDEGILRSGGRPGLTELLLSATLEDCEDETATGRRARVIWLGWTLLYLAGLYAMLLELLRGRAHRIHDAALGMAMLALVPAFLDWSLQVRTDQPALAGGAWGGAALLASRRQPVLALAAGVCLGMGWLSSQKLFYVAALAGLLALGALVAVREWRPGRELARGALILAGFGAVWLGFHATVETRFALPEAHVSTRVIDPVLFRDALDVFTFYRKTIGYSQYVAILPTLIPHATLGTLLAFATLAALRRRNPDARLGLAWAVAALGVAVGAFHAGAFGYFWMTLGLFPAVALALGIERLRDALCAWQPRMLRPAAALTWLALIVPAALESALLLRDTQAVQREALAFVRRNFEPTHAGFHPERGLFCSAPQPIRLWFSYHIYQQFGSEERAGNSEALLAQFRDGQIHFLLQSFRLNQFPVEVRRFWAENYQPYRGALFVAGRRLAGDETDADFEIVAPGPYRWLPIAPRDVEIDGRTVAPGESLALEAGLHTATFAGLGAGGLLVRALDEPPGPAPRSFYKTY